LEPTANEPRPWYRSAIGSLVIVLAVIAGAAWLVRRMVPAFRASESGAMVILARTPVSQRQAIALLQVGRRVLVLGLSPGRVDPLAEIEEPCEVAELLACAGGRAPGPRFNRILAERADEFAADALADGHEEGLGANSKPIAALLRRLKLLQKSA
jgi:flagellar protein FliO/FliZ